MASDFNLRSFWTKVQTFILLMGLVCFQSVAPALAQTQQPMTLTVDFGKTTPVKSMSGFLHGIGREPAIPNGLLNPLKPKWWRIDPWNISGFKQAAALGARVQVVISDSYGYPLNNWNGKGAPWENNFKNWEDNVRMVARLYAKMPVYFDVWNEPDVADWNKAQFWNGTQEQFFETYKRAYKVLREELGPDAPIGGPSYANYDEPGLARFLAFSQANGLEVNFISWHELWNEPNNIADIPKHVATVRNMLAQYPNLKNQAILLNESVGVASHMYPAESLAYLYYLEKSGVDGTNRACWNATNGSNNCWNGTVDGLLYSGPGGAFTPRPAWWAYKFYADGVDGRIASESTSPNLLALPSNKPTSVLFAYYGKDVPPAATVNLQLVNLPPNPKGVNSLGVQVVRVPAFGEKAMRELINHWVGRVNVQDGKATIPIPNVRLHEAYMVKLTP